MKNSILFISLALIVLSSCTVTTPLSKKEKPYDFTVEDRKYLVFDCWEAQEDPDYYYLDLRYVNDSVKNRFIAIAADYYYPGDTVTIEIHLKPNYEIRKVAGLH